MVMLIYILPSLFLGWSLGANDAANVFGPPVVNGVIRFRTATIVASIFVVLGAVLQGSKGLSTIGGLTEINLATSAVSMFAAALTVTIMTFFGLPVSTTQAVVGALTGAGLLINGHVDAGKLVKIMLSWVGTPFGAFVFGFVLYIILSYPFRLIKNVKTQDLTIKVATWIFGAYASYSLGANNVANVTGALVGRLLNIQLLALIGGLSIAFGILTFSRRVMLTVGKSIVELDYFSSLVVVLGSALTVWIYALIGVPVSSSQAIVGAVIGAGFARGTRIGNTKMVMRVVYGWVGTPIISGLMCVTMLGIISVFL
ncbi:MAG: hypothetical protein PWQ27_1143 [Kosmotoga sp.]|nr:hypothetical protein [Kosmotoga sp.]